MTRVPKHPFPPGCEGAERNRILMEFRTPAVMIQGTGSNVGKSLIVAGLCRAFARPRPRVAPFKPQNMSNNAARHGGRRRDRARPGAAGARRAGAAEVHMNPVLLKPETETGAQVIVQGRRVGTLDARELRGRKPDAAAGGPRRASRGLRASADLVLVEGAGSPAEINLRAGDIANMGFAAAADVPVVLVGDIDRGGVIASLVGTHAVLDAGRSATHPRLPHQQVPRRSGAVRRTAWRRSSARTGWPSLGVVPWLPMRRGCRRRMSLGLDARRGASRCARSDRRAAAAADREFRRPRSAARGARMSAGRRPGRASRSRATPTSCSCRARKRRSPTSRSLRAQGWDIDIARACPARRARARPLRRLPDARPHASRIRRASRARRASVDGLGLLDVDDRDGRRQDDRAGRRPALRERRRGDGLRDPPRPHRRARLRAARSCDIAGRPDGALSPRRPRRRAPTCTACSRATASAGRSCASSARDGGGSPTRREVEAALDALAAHLEAHLDLDRHPRDCANARARERASAAKRQQQAHAA